MAKKLLSQEKSPKEERGSEITDYGMFECLSGPNRGKKRVIAAFYDPSRGNSAITNDHLRFVSAITETSSGSYRVDFGTPIVYDTKADTITFSSNFVQYIIRPITDEDNVYSGGTAEETATNG